MLWLPKKWKAIFETTVSIPVTHGEFLDKVVTDIDGFTDKPEFQCDIQIVKTTCVNDT